MEEARTNTHEETKKKISLCITGVSREALDKTPDNSDIVPKKGYQNRVHQTYMCALDITPDRALNTVAKWFITCLGRFTRYQMCLVCHRIPYRIGYSKRLDNN
jgi:hypothetical protein